MARKIVIDFFAGGGGASEGLAEALGRGPDIAINHDAEALAMHAANHPKTRHVLEDVWAADLRKMAGKRQVGLAWFSPDCRHFSRAKGGKPVSKGVRSLAWIVVKAADQLRPDVIILENVREFADWGPLIPQWKCRKCEWKGTEGQTVLARSRRRCPRCESVRLEIAKIVDKHSGDLVDAMIPCPKRKGLTFKKWAGRLRNLGYSLQYKTLDAADFGAPTHRKRLFLIARRDGKPIVWPEPTHADPKRLDRYPLFDRPKPYRTAAEIIDFDLPALSIFATPEEARAWAKEHKRGIPQRPLKEKTLRRIALGIKRYVLEAAKPFIVRCDHGGDHFRGQSLDTPLSTVAGDHGFGLVTPFVANVQNGTAEEFRGQGVAEPLATVTAKPAGGGFALVSPCLIGAGGSAYAGKPRSVDQPMNVVKCENRQALVAPVLSKFHGQKAGESRCLPLDAPINTLDTQNRYAMVAPTLIQTGYGEREGQAPRVPGLDKPLGTVVNGQKHAVVAAHLSKFFGTAIGQPLDEPAPTTTASGKHTALAAAHLVKFRGDSDGQAVDRPLPTVTSGAGAARPAGAAHALGLSAAYLVKNNHGDKQWNSLDDPLCTVTSQGNKFGVAYAFLAKYFGTAIAQPLDTPLGTITQRARYGLVTVEMASGTAEPAVAIEVPGVGTCIIADIALRMLRPRELARANGFRDSYILTGPTDCQVAKIGNSVPPVMAKVLAENNYSARASCRVLQSR